MPTTPTGLTVTTDKVMLDAIMSHLDAEDLRTVSDLIGSTAINRTGPGISLAKAADQVIDEVAANVRSRLADMVIDAATQAAAVPTRVAPIA